MGQKCLINFFIKMYNIYMNWKWRYLYTEPYLGVRIEPEQIPYYLEDEVNRYIRKHYVKEQPKESKEKRPSDIKFSLEEPKQKTEHSTIRFSKTGLSAPSIKLDTSTKDENQENEKEPKQETENPTIRFSKIGSSSVDPSTKLYVATKKPERFYDFKNDDPTFDEIDKIIKKHNKNNLTWQQLLFKFIDERDFTDREVYKRAYVDRRLFSKIRSNANYMPSKPTVIRFCFALQLDYEETLCFLNAAGYTLSRSIVFDVVVEYFIKKRIYDLGMLQTVLFKQLIPF